MGKISVSQDPGLDQVFMTDKKMLEKIVAVSGLKKDECVLEIGTGLGNLTEALAKKCKRVITVEIDDKLRPEIERRFRDEKNVRILWGNALEVIEKERLNYDRIVANPPYAISEALIKALFGRHFIAAILTLPWKFVERLTANPEEDYYSRLSLLAQTFFRIEALLRVDRDAWTPRPGTESIVVRLTPRKPVNKREKLLMELALQDDKKMHNALREALVKSGYNTKRRAVKAIEDAGFPREFLQRRVSELPLEDILNVLERFENGKKI